MIIHLGRENKLPLEISINEKNELNICLPTELDLLPANSLQLKVGEHVFNLPLKKPILLNDDLKYGNRIEASLIIQTFKNEGAARTLNCFSIFRNDSPEIKINKIPERDTLTALDVRNLFLRGGLPLERHAPPDYIPKTDLHTHWTAILPPEKVLDVVEKKFQKSGFYYPAEYLKKMGINTKSYLTIESDQFPEMINTKEERDEMLYDPGLTSKQENVDKELKEKKYINIFDLTENDYKKLKESLSLPTHTCVVFSDMEEYYLFREPFLKQLSLFKEYLWTVGEEYASNAISVSEISFSKVLDPKWLWVIQQEISKINDKYGVNLLFLASISRNLSQEEIEEKIHQFEIISSQCPYVRGVDILSDETNSTYDFLLALKALAEWGRVHFPKMVIRIHAGETSYHQENVFGALTLAAQYPQITVRVGHGLHGIDDKIIPLALAQKNFFIEFNPVSNHSLNMQVAIEDHPVQTYLNSGVPCFIGTDGHGLYGTDNVQSIDCFRYLDLKNFDSVISSIKETEENYLQRIGTFIFLREWDYLRKCHKLDSPEGAGSFDKKKSDFIYLTSEHPLDGREIVLSKKLQQVKFANRFFKLEGFLCENKITPYVDDRLRGKIPIMITGGLLPGSKIDDYQSAYAFIESLISTLNPQKIYFFTPGNNLGIQKYVHDAIQRYNDSQTDIKNQFCLVGHLPKTAKVKDLTPALTHSIIDCETWYDELHTIQQSLEKDNLQLIVIGENMLTRNMIQAAYNAVSNSTVSRKKLILIKGPAGASTEKANELPPEVSENNFEGALKNLYSLHQDWFLASPLEFFEIQKQQQLNDLVYLSLRQGRLESSTLKNKINHFYNAFKLANITHVDKKMILEFIKSLSQTPSQRGTKLIDLKCPDCAIAKILEDNFFLRRTFEILFKETNVSLQLDAEIKKLESKQAFKKENEVVDVEQSSPPGSARNRGGF